MLRAPVNRRALHGSMLPACSGRGDIARTAVNLIQHPSMALRARAAGGVRFTRSCAVGAPPTPLAAASRQCRQHSTRTCIAQAASSGEKGGAAAGSGAGAPPAAAALDKPSVPAAAPVKQQQQPAGNGVPAAAGAAAAPPPGQQPWAWKVRRGMRSNARKLLGLPQQHCVLPAAAMRKPLPYTKHPMQGANLRNLGIAVGLGAALRLGVPVPEGLDPQAWTLLGIFLTTIAGLVLEPVAAGGWAVMCVSGALVSHTMTFKEAFQATDSPVLWLIICAFFLAKGIEKTGLGTRIAELLVRSFGGSTRSLGLSLAVGELLMTPGMPSTTARAAGVFVPVIRSVSAAGGSYPTDEVSRNKIGAYLTLSQLSAGSHSSTLLLTGAAQNLLCLQLAQGIGVDVGSNNFLTWAQGACVPALLGTLLMPFLVYYIQRPTVEDTPEAPQQAAARLAEMGPLSQDETVMVVAVSMALTLWVFGEQVGVPPVVAAMLAVGLLVAAGVLDWKQDCLRGCPQAFDTLVWFGILVSMSLTLQQKGVIDVFTGWASSGLGSLGLPWPALFGALHLLFFALHYLFAAQTSHVGALYTAFLSLMIAGGVPPKMAALTLGYNICLMGGITHYASSQAAAYYGSGFLKLRELWLGGAITGAVSLALWGTVGMAWWKAIGWW